MTAFNNMDALVADQTGTTLSQADADLLMVIVGKLIIKDDKMGPILLGNIEVTDTDGAAAGEERARIAGTPADNPFLSIKVLSQGKVDAELWADRDGVSVRLQRITYDAVFSFA